MTNLMKRLGAIGALAALSLASVGQAEEMIYSGFMSDYSQLTKVEDDTADFRFLADDIENRMINYNAVMIDEPEIFIANDSEYRGVKPKHFAALAESLRAGIAAGLHDKVYVVDRPGENVLYLSVAITNLKLNKRKKKAWNYLPVALVVGGVAGAASSEIAKKADFGGLVFEFEAFDSVTDERLVALIDHLDSLSDEEPNTWEDVDAFMQAYGRLIACRFQNARVPEDERANCFAEL